MLSFVIPVRHHLNARNWDELIHQLCSTIQSISQQTDDDWRAVIVVNRGSKLPAIQKPFQFELVDFPPNKFHDRESVPIEVFHDAVRLDKGRRILAGMLALKEGTDYFMVVDDDDFISRNLSHFVRQHRGANGWEFKSGFVWSSGGKFLFIHPDFNKYCGTSHIIRADLLGLPADFASASDEYVKRSLGSHVFIADDLKSQGTPLSPLPFPGAIYRIGHNGSHSRSSTLFRTFLFKKKMLKRPATLLASLFRFRLLSESTSREFFGKTV